MLTHIHPSLHMVYMSGLVPKLRASVIPAQCPGQSKNRQVPRAPLPASGVTCSARSSQHLVRGRYPSFIAHTDSCARPKPSHRLRSPYTAGLCRLLSAPAGRWPFPTLSPQSVYRCLDPYPAVPLRCSCPFLPEEHRPHHQVKRFGTRNIPAMQLQQGHVFRGCSHSLMFRLPYSLGPQVAPTAGLTVPGQPGRLHHAMNMGLPPTNRGIATCPNRTN